LTFSHYPGLPFPFGADLPVSAEQPCPYRPDRLSRSRAFAMEEMPPSAYHRLMDAGFRRSGEYFYQPICRGCRACVPLRVPVPAFAPSASQRRVCRRNADLRITVAPVDYRDEDFALYRRYSREWHGKDVSDDDYTAFLVDSPVATAAFRYRDAAGRLLAVGICDVCDESLSSVYFFFDPGEASRGLGTYGAVQEIAWAAGHQIPYYYLGFWINDCAAMSYKARFRPYELLGTDGVWRSSGTED